MPGILRNAFQSTIINYIFIYICFNIKLDPMCVWLQYKYAVGVGEKQMNRRK